MTSKALGSLNQSAVRESLISVISDNVQPQASLRKVKLPKLELRKFNENLRTGLSFGTVSVVPYT